jgi:HK97 family phage portal protein
MFNFFKKEQTDNTKYINSEIGTITNTHNLPRFNRQIAVNAYTGFWASAIDYNANAAASGIIRLYAKVSKNGQKCIFPTTKNNRRQRDFMNGKLIEQPDMLVSHKTMDSIENFEVVQGHNIIDLFMRANPLQSSFQLFYEIFLSLEITGDAFIHVVSNTDGTPQQLYVLQAQYMRIQPAPQGSGRFIDKYVYKENQGGPVDYSPDEIIHVKYPNPNSIWYGMGKIEKGWQSYLLNKFSHEYQIALYANNAVPDYLLVNKSGNSISKKRFFKKMTNLTRGASNRGKVMAIDGDVDIKTVAFKPKDLSDVTLNIQEIASISGCPINKLIGNDNVKANSEEQNTSWLRNTILPMMKLVASTLGENLLPRYGIEDTDAFLLYDNPVPADTETQRKIHETYKNTGVMTANEIRAELGLEIHENGDELGSKDPEPIIPPQDDDKGLSKAISTKIDSLVQEVVRIQQIETQEVKQPTPAPIVINIGETEQEIEDEEINNSTNKGISEVSSNIDIEAENDSENLLDKITDNIKDLD